MAKVYSFDEAMQIFRNKKGFITLHTRMSCDGGRTFAQIGQGWGQRIWADGELMGAVTQDDINECPQSLVSFKTRSFGITKQMFLKAANQLLNGQISTGEIIVIGENALNPGSNYIFKIFLKVDVEGFDRQVDMSDEGDWSGLGL